MRVMIGFGYTGPIAPFYVGQTGAESAEKALDAALGVAQQAITDAGLTRVSGGYAWPDGSLYEVVETNLRTHKQVRAAMDAALEGKTPKVEVCSLGRYQPHGLLVCDPDQEPDEILKSGLSDPACRVGKVG